MAPPAARWPVCLQVGQDASTNQHSTVQCSSQPKVQLGHSKSSAQPSHAPRRAGKQAGRSLAPCAAAEPLLPAAALLTCQALRAVAHRVDGFLVVEGGVQPLHLAQSQHCRGQRGRGIAGALSQACQQPCGRVEAKGKVTGSTAGWHACKRSSPGRHSSPPPRTCQRVLELQGQLHGAAAVLCPGRLGLRLAPLGRLGGRLGLHLFVPLLICRAQKESSQDCSRCLGTAVATGS